MNKKVYEIKGFDCANCAKKVEAHLNKHEKIEEAVIDFSADRLHITYKDEPLSVKEILRIIKEVENDPITVEELGAGKKVSYCITGFDCANCAAEMTEGIKKLPGVIDANVNFLTQKLSMELEEGVDLGELMPKVIKTCKKVDPECEVIM